jgi:type I restriction enzyme S subunit
MAKAKKDKMTLEDALVPVGEQPYEVPENWCWTYQNYVCQLGDGIKLANEEYPYLEVKYLRGNTEADIKSSGKYIPEHTKVILVDGENSGEVFETCEAGYMGSTFKTLNISPNINEKYLLYFVNSKQELLRNNKTGSAIPHLNKKLFFSLALPLSPLAEQQRIVDQIENLFSKLDEAKEKIQDVIDNFDIRMVSILHDAFNGVLTDNWRKENNIDLNTWKKIPLKNCGRWFGGGTPTTSVKEYWENGNIPWITSKDMKDKVIDDSLMHITMTGVENSSANYCEKPAVLFVMRSGILRRTFPVCMVKRPFTVNQDLKACVPDGIIQEYLYWACTCYEKDIRDNCMKSGTTVESVEAQKLMNYEIPVASKSEQLEIVNRLELLLNKEEQAKEIAQNALETIDLMKKSILAKAFRGELATNNPEEESSIELLRDILESVE